MAWVYALDNVDNSRNMCIADICFINQGTTSIALEKMFNWVRNNNFHRIYRWLPCQLRIGLGNMGLFRFAREYLRASMLDTLGYMGFAVLANCIFKQFFEFRIFITKFRTPEFDKKRFRLGEIARGACIASRGCF